jgi:uncharacterized RDD family membrane protein YckC
MTAQPGSEQIHFAGFVSRAIALMVDIIAILTIAAVFRLTVQAVLQFFNNIVPYFDVEMGERATSILGLFTGGLLQIAYFLLFWTFFGQTPGMAVMGIQVLRKDARPPTLLYSFIRYIGLLLSFLALGLGFLWVLVDRRRRGWHDKLSGTYVVYADSARAYHRQILAAKRRAQATSSQVLSQSR